MTADPNIENSKSFRAESYFPPPPTVVPLATLAMDRNLADPVQMHGLTARRIFETGAARRYDATRLRRILIEGCWSGWPTFAISWTPSMPIPTCSHC